MSDPPASFPTAQVAPAGGPRQLVGKLHSRLWSVTGLCFIAAIGLALSEFRTSGTSVTVRFADGSGIEPGDKVRYLGIEVGIVEAVTLEENLERVKVRIEFDADSISLAREGSRFWIERPDFRLGHVRGLDTLMGGRYVGVLPGPVKAPRSNEFEGLGEPPIRVENLYDGLEIMLESAARYGLERGSPVSYRGIEIGQVLDVGLASNSSMVVARLFIRPGYRALIRENSRFWSNSGIDLRFGLKGFEFDAETLSTIAAGGVALATPDEPGPRVATGHRFELSKSPREEWLEWQPQLAIGVAALGDDMQLPAPVLAVCRGEGRFSFFHRATQRGWLLPLDSGKLLGPADMLVDSSEKRQELEIWGSTIPLPKEGVVEQGKLASRTITAELLPVESPWPVARIKHIGSQEHLPEKLIITCGSDNQTFLLDAKQASKSAGHWQIEPQTPLDASWHGACVVSASDGYLVGIVVSTPEGVRIEPIGEGLGERD